MSDFINLDAAYDSDTLTDWYISSVGSEPPVWTDEHIEELLNDFYVIPKDATAADVEPVRHGHWEGIEGESCSVCGKNAREHIVCEFYWYNSMPEFCPHCGAKMDEQ